MVCKIVQTSDLVDHGPITRTREREREMTSKKQVRSDNDASEVGILGHFGTFWTLWDILGRFGRRLDEFGAFRLFSQSFPTIFSHNRLGHFSTFFDILGHLETFWDI